MVRVVGIDPGTKSFDVCGLDAGRLFMEKSIGTEEIRENPRLLVDVLLNADHLDAVVGPSGYGIPLRRADEIGDRDVRLMTLMKRDDPAKGQLLALGAVVKALRASNLRVYLIPGVIHLPTVPAHRKANKIDMGTADKVCSTALAIRDQSRRHKIPYDATSFIMVEMGYGFNATIAVEGGQIVDGIGGTMGGPGFTAAGGLDGEVAYLLGSMSKGILFSGGATYMAEGPGITPEELPSRGGIGWAAFLEGIEKNVSAATVSVKKPREILLSGRLARVEAIRAKVSEALFRYGKVRTVEGLAQIAKESAQGAALIADGLAGGEYKALVETMKIRNASGTVFDNIYLPNFGEVRKNFST